MKISGLRRIAERYVRALFDVAAAAHALDAVERDMSCLESALAQNEDFRHFLTNPLLAREPQEKAMDALLAKMAAHELTRQFMVMLVRQKRLAVLPAIAQLFIEWAEKARGEMKAELLAAAPLKEKDVSRIGDMLGKAYGKKMNLEVKENPALLGGIVVKIGSVQLDGSLAGKLARLEVALKAA